VQHRKLTPANTVILSAGVVMVLGSFLAFYKFSFGGFSKSYNAWNRDVALFGVATIPVLFGVIMAAHVAIATFASTNLPARVLGFTWDQIHVALGFQATVMMVAFFVRDKGPYDFGVGFYLMLVAAIALLVGAVMRQREGATAF
jgi:hypothetical protein